MFKSHPKGLLSAALANMGERFGFYTMMAILVLFLSAKFGLSETQAGTIYSIFYASIYFLALVGGIIADKTKKYKSTIFMGLVIMAVGYLLMAIPTPTDEILKGNVATYLAISCAGLLVIAFGNGLFKGNLQAVVGQMYDDPKYSKFRDTGFAIFYMFINVGAIFAPLLAIYVRNWWLSTKGFAYDATLPEMCHALLNGTITPEATNALQTAANGAMLDGSTVTDLTAFAGNYINHFSTGLHYAFATAIGAMAISLVIYLVNMKKLPDPAAKKVVSDSGAPAAEEVKMSTDEIKKRLYALFAVFGIVIFFWFSFHQNGLTLSYFARDYVDLSMISVPLGEFVKLEGAEIFQSLNPLFVVCLTPLVIFIFDALARRNRALTTSKKIAIGMAIAASAYVFVSLMSIGLPTKSEVVAMGALDVASKVSPWVLIITYLILTIAELFISPLGLSFVSKVAPPHLQGIMQGMWLAATGIGNMILFLGAYFYMNWELSYAWAFFAGACALSMCIMFGMVKWLDKIAK